MARQRLAYSRNGARGPRPRILDRQVLRVAAPGVEVVRYRLECGHVRELFGLTKAQRMQCPECRVGGSAVEGL